jgi:bifunctional ADP-heptose synthase (sugar kinase/adenylyltransferase)
MDSDERVRQLKGLGHPILNWVERASMFNYMPVDGLVEFNSEDELEKIIVQLGPTLRVQGGDRVNITSRFPEVPKMFITDTGLHTGMIIARVLDRMGK